MTKYKHIPRHTGYVFPILYKQIHKILGYTRKGLKKIAELCNFDVKRSTYVARHSFPTILKNAGVNIALISEALAHSELTTTQIYLDSYEKKQFDEAMKHLL